jgi:hypothetical protein
VAIHLITLHPSIPSILLTVFDLSTRSLLSRVNRPTNQQNTSIPCAGATMKFTTTTTVLWAATAASAAILKRQNQGDG